MARDVVAATEEDFGLGTLRARLEDKLKKQENSLCHLGQGITELDRLSRAIYPFFPEQPPSSVSKADPELADLLKAEQTKAQSLALQVQTLTQELESLKSSQPASPQLASELTLAKQTNSRLLQDLEASKAELKSLKATEKTVKRNVRSLEKNFEQLSTMYNQAIEQKNALRADSLELEKALREKDSVIELLERKVKETEEDAAAATRNLANANAVYVAGRASFPGSRVKKAGRQLVKVLEPQPYSHRLSLRSSSDLAQLLRKGKRRTSVDGTE